jgi:hypothetical protein
MSDPKIAIATVAIGGWYSRGVARMLREIERVSPGYKVSAWVNCYPPGAPGPVVRHGVDYGGYCAKPFALKALMDGGADIGLLLDASFYPVKHLLPLFCHISQAGYYMAPDGFTIGQWASDEMLDDLTIERDAALTWEGCASGCVGIDFRTVKGRRLVDKWIDLWPLFPGYHSNDKAGDTKHSYRNIGHVSNDPRCLGHRHDQSALGIMAHLLGMTDYFSRPRFSAYEGAQPDWPEFTHANNDTVLLCRGM